MIAEEILKCRKECRAMESKYLVKKLKKSCKKSYKKVKKSIWILTSNINNNNLVMTSNINNNNVSYMSYIYSHPSVSWEIGSRTPRTPWRPKSKDARVQGWRSTVGPYPWVLHTWIQPPVIRNLQIGRADCICMLNTHRIRIHDKQQMAERV